MNWSVVRACRRMSREAMSWHETPVPVLLRSSRYHRTVYNPWSARFGRKLLRYMHSDWIEGQVVLADKVAVRELVAERVGAGYLATLYVVVDRPREIEFDTLPNRFYLKANHGARFNIPCEDKAELDVAVVRRKLRKFLATDFSRAAGERQYRDIPRKVFAEEYLDLTQPHSMMIRLFSFDGDVAFIQVDTHSERRTPTETGWFLPDWSPSPFRYGREYPGVDIPRPANLDEVLRVACALSEGIPFVRVDLYWINGRIVFSELALTPARGTRRIRPKSYDVEIGRLFTLPKESSMIWVNRLARLIDTSVRARLGAGRSWLRRRGRRLARRLTRRLMKAELLWQGIHRALGLQRLRKRRAVRLSSIPEQVTHVIVPGAGVRPNGTISQVLRERLDRAAEVARTRPDVKVLVSGDGRKKSHREDQVMKADLVAHGVSPERVVTDPRGYSTMATMDGARRRGIRSAVIVTNDFHMARSVHVAVGVGIDAYVVRDHRSTTYTDADRPLRFDERRELVAHVKDWVVLATRRPRRLLASARAVSADAHAVAE